jgi:hypothetical protein
MYKIIKRINEIKCIKKLSDNSFIPLDKDNTDYQEYLKWLEEGNTPLPADNSPQENN